MRLTRDEWAMQMAVVTAQRATCIRRRVGCVLLDGRGLVLSTGYNGVASGRPHCNESVIGGLREFPHACPGWKAPSGESLDGCHAIHAEQNALLQCTDVWRIDTCYATSSPCMTCIKLLLNTSCNRIVFAEPYAHGDARALWEGANRKWEQLEMAK